MQIILSEFLFFNKTIKGGKSGSGKYYYFLLPNNRIIQVDAQSSATCGKLRCEEVQTTRRQGNKHDIQIEK